MVISMGRWTRVPTSTEAGADLTVCGAGVAEAAGVESDLRQPVAKRESAMVAATEIGFGNVMPQAFGAIRLEAMSHWERKHVAIMRR